MNTSSSPRNLQRDQVCTPFFYFRDDFFDTFPPSVKKGVRYLLSKKGKRYLSPPVPFFGRDTGQAHVACVSDVLRQEMTRTTPHAPRNPQKATDFHKYTPAIAKT